MTQPVTSPTTAPVTDPASDPLPDPATESIVDPGSDEAPRCANIGDRGADTRRRHGLIAGMAGLGAGIYMIAAEVPTTTLWILLLPFTWAALGFLQARERT